MQAGFRHGDLEILSGCFSRVIAMKKILNRQDGFSLIEVLVAMGLLAGSFLFLAQLMLTGMQGNYISRDDTRLNALANDRMEQLKTMSFDDLGDPCLDGATLCGDLTANFTDTSVTPNVKYFDDGNANYVVRWTISLTDGVNPLPDNTKRLTVTAISTGLNYIGNQRNLVIYYDKVKY
jgi:prepilin-type N-terminal cleavage/methylation domain-containing protein